jgi:acyl-CoA hydrolase
MPLSPNLSVQIKQAALATLSPKLAASAKLSIANQVFPSGHVFRLVDTVLTVKQPAALVFVDLKPGANWGHPCVYQFYDPTSGKLLYTQDALFPPNLAGDIPLEIFHSPVVRPIIPISPVATPIVPAVPATTPGGPISPVVSPIPAQPIVPFRPPLKPIIGRILSRGLVSQVQVPASDAIEQRYAILWTSQISDRRHVEDLEFFWRLLVNVFGFPSANVYVLCYNGTIGSVDVTGSFGNWYGDNTAYQMKVHSSATTSNLQAVFNTLTGKLKPKDLLFIHTNNHGSTTGLCVDNSSVIAPSDFGTMLKGLPAYRALIVTMEQCFSGAFQSPTLTNSSAVDTVFASAVDANTSSDGASHFDPWALALAEALNGATASGGALSSKPIANLDGLVSIKAACDWAKANDTGSDDDPQYADQPPGCGSRIFLGLSPALPDQDGDVNADGCSEIVVTSPWGLGILEQLGGTMRQVAIAANGTRFGGWLLNTADNLVGPLAKFSGGSQAEIFISSPWGVGILQLSGTTLNAPMMQPNGTRFGGWLLNTADNLFGPAADFDGDGADEIFVRSPWGIGILKLSGSTLSCPMLQPNGTRFGGWLLNTADNVFGPAADYDGDGKAEILVVSPWGIGILKLSGNTMSAPMMQPNGTRFGGWLLNTADNSFGRAGDYNGDGKAELLVQSPWGIGLLELSGSTMSAPMMQPNGTRFGGWLLDTFNNVFGPSADYDGDGKVEVLITSSWGIGVLKLSGNTLSSPVMAANGTRFNGGWLLNTADNHFGPASSFEGGPVHELFISSPWGIGILRMNGNTFDALMLQPNGTRFGGWLLNTVDNQF